MADSTMADPLGALRDFYVEHVKRHGAGLSGAAFGCGWWAWADGVLAASHKVPFVQWLPGLVATLALLLINSVRWDEIQGLDPWDEDVYCRSRTWMLIAYGTSVGAMVGAAAVMIGVGGGAVGLACVLQVACILGAALLFFLSRSEGEGGGGYDMF